MGVRLEGSRVGRGRESRGRKSGAHVKRLKRGFSGWFKDGAG